MSLFNTISTSLTDFSSGINTFLQGDNGRNRIKFDAGLSVVNSIGGFFQQRQEAQRAEAYYEAVARNRSVAKQNSLKLTAASNELILKIAETQADILEQNASTLYSNAINLANAATTDLERGNRITSFRVGEAKAAFANAGVAQSGSVKTTVSGIAKESFREVDINFRESINRISNTLQASAMANFEAAMTRFSAEEETKLRTAQTEAGLE